MTDSSEPTWDRSDGAQPRYVVQPLAAVLPDRTPAAVTRSSMLPFVAAPVAGWLCFGAGLIFGVSWLWMLGIGLFVLGAVAVVIGAVAWERGPGRPGPAPRTNAMSVSSLVLGVAFPPLAIPLGHIARSQMRRTGERGRRLALAGLTLGYGGVLSATVGLLVVVGDVV
ncbi:MAG: DUF4190 domain-containing protein [Mycobacterium sp.]